MCSLAVEYMAGSRVSPASVSLPTPGLTLSHRTILLLSLGLAATLAFSSAALAAPAGDEYLPKVPDAAGSAAPAKGGNLTADPGETTTTTDTGTSASGTGGTKGNGDQRQDGKKSDAGSTPKPAAATDTSSSGGGGSSGLIVLVLIVVAVIVVAGGMILRRRAGLTEGDDDDDDRGDGSGPGGTPSARPTPDGEIVAGREKT
jgi:hypothetical protein